MYMVCLISEQILSFTADCCAVNAMVQSEDLPRFANSFEMCQMRLLMTLRRGFRRNSPWNLPELIFSSRLFRERVVLAEE